MSRAEIMSTRYGEMLDMLSCLAIYEGRLRYKRRQRRHMAFDEAIKLL